MDGMLIIDDGDGVECWYTLQGSDNNEDWNDDDDIDIITYPMLQEDWDLMASRGWTASVADDDHSEIGNEVIDKIQIPNIRKEECEVESVAKIAMWIYNHFKKTSEITQYRNPWVLDPLVVLRKSLVFPHSSSYYFLFGGVTMYTTKNSWLIETHLI